MRNVLSLAVMVIGATVACAKDAPPPRLSRPAFVIPGRATYTRDSAGIEILEFPLPVKSLPVILRIDSVPLLDLGGQRADSAHNLEQPEGDQYALPLAGSTPGYLVKDRNDLKLFDGENNYVATIGSGGSGRGQFQQLNGFCVADGDTVLALDESRVSVFTRSGKFVRSSPYLQGFVEPSGCFTDGTLLLLTDHRQDSTAIARFAANAVRIRRDGREVRRISAVEAGTSSPSIFMRTNNVVFRDLLISGDGRKAEVRIFRMSGRLRRVIRWNESPTLVSPDLLREFIANTVRADEFDEAIERGFGTVQPSSLPVYDELQVDEAGRIWMLDYPEVLISPQPPVLWTVFDSTGAPMGRVEQPVLPDAINGPTIVWIGKDQVLLRWTDREQFVHLTYHRIAESGERRAGSGEITNSRRP